MNLKFLQARTFLTALKLLPPEIREAEIRRRIGAALDTVDGGAVGLGMVLGLIRDGLPSDPRVLTAFNTFAEELWRWWKDGGGK